MARDYALFLEGLKTWQAQLTTVLCQIKKD